MNSISRTLRHGLVDYAIYFRALSILRVSPFTVMIHIQGKRAITLKLTNPNLNFPICNGTPAEKHKTLGEDCTNKQTENSKNECTEVWLVFKTLHSAAIRYVGLEIAGGLSTPDPGTVFCYWHSIRKSRTYKPSVRFSHSS